MVFRIGGLASGMDTDNIIREMMNAQRIPVDRLFQKKQIIEWQRDAYREMNSKIMDYRNNQLSNFRLESTFRAKTTEITGDTTAISAKVTGNTEEGSLTIKVTDLAVAAAKWSGADIRHATDKTFDASKSLSSQEAKLDGSTFTQTNYTININGTDVAIDTTKDSLNTVIDKINKNTNVSAFFDTQTGKVSFKAKDTGITNGVNGDQAHITFVDDGNFLSDILNIDVAGNTVGVDSTAAADANVTINGLATTRSSNTFSVNGIEVTLLKATGNEATITVNNDTEKIIETIKNFISSYNEILASIQEKVGEAKYRDFAPLTDAQKEDMSDKEIELWEQKAMSGLLKNDSILNRAMNEMRIDISSQVDTGSNLYKTLSSIGIETGSYNERGKLYLVSESKLRAALEADPAAIEKLFAAAGNGDADRSDEGIASRMYDDLKVSMNRISQISGSSLALHDSSFLSKSLDRLDTRIEDANRRLSDVEARYYRQFTAMERAISQMNMQSSYLANAFGGGQ